MNIIMGKSGTGKSTIVKNLVNKYGMKQIVTYTTRPIRPGEVQDETYHYIDNHDFWEKSQNGFFAEWKYYFTNQGVWYYGTALEDILNSDNDTVIILTPDGAENIYKYDIPLNIILIESDKSVVEERLIQRGDKEDEIKRRMKADDEDFANVMSMVNKVIDNTGKTLDAVTKELYEYIKREDYI